MLTVGTSTPLAAEFHHPGAGLDVCAVRVVGHVRHAHERMVQSFAWSDSALLKSKSNLLPMSFLDGKSKTFVTFDRFESTMERVSEATFLKIHFLLSVLLTNSQSTGSFGFKKNADLLSVGFEGTEF